MAITGHRLQIPQLPLIFLDYTMLYHLIYFHYFKLRKKHRQIKTKKIWKSAPHNKQITLN